MELPVFTYHPDPISTQNVVKSNATCLCCRRETGFIYVGPLYAVEEFDHCICPWCIADGSAHQELEASFTDENEIGGGGMWEDVSDQIKEEVAYRTPGFCGWQQEKWWTHCRDAGQFLGRAGRKELEALGAGAIAAIQQSVRLSSAAWEKLFSALKKEGSPTAYVFRCRKCGQFGGYQDSI